MAADSEDTETTVATLTGAGGEQTTSLSLSSSAESSTDNSSRLDATRRELERWQLHHSIQLLKLELSQKNMIIDSMRTDHAHQTEELTENITELQSNQKLLQQRLRALTKVYEEERNDLRKQLEEARKPRLQSPPTGISEEELNERLQELFQQQSLPTDQTYDRLSLRGTDSLTPHELVQVRLYEVTRPFVKEGAQLREEVRQLRLAAEKEQKEKMLLVKKLKEEESELYTLQTQFEQLTVEKAKLVANRHSRDFKSEHYDIVKSERDAYERELESLKHSLIEKEFREKAMTEEREKTQTELSSVHQSVLLLKQDKDYLQKQVTELSQRARESEEKCEDLLRKLNDCKQSKENLYEQLMRQRQEQKNEYETRLHRELDSLRLKTNSELDQLKVQTREMYERESRALQQARDSAQSDRDRALGKQKELEEKYEQIHNELRKLQVSSDGQVSELSSELQMKTFELDRVRVLYEETMRSLKRSEKDRQQMREKLETLANDSERSIKDLQSLVRELEMKLKEKGNRLEGYEKLEHELDDVVMSAANMEDEQDAERVLFSYGFGTSVPSSARRRMQQSVQLARRVLKLERINASLRQQLESEDRDKKILSNELSSLKSQLELSSQPHKYLVETLKSRDYRLEKLTNANAKLDGKINDLEKKLAQTIEEKNRLTIDLERLLSHQEELGIIKNLVTSLGSSGRGPTSLSLSGKGRKCTDSQRCQPQPTIFTRPDPLQSSNRTNQRN